MNESSSMTPLLAGHEGGPAAELLVDQCRRWQRGERVRVEAYLEQQPALQTDADAVLDLICNELLLRKQGGEKPSLDEYLQRFPEVAGQLRLQFEVENAIQPDHSGVNARSQGTEILAQDRTDALVEHPQTIAGYEIVGVLGRGGAGIVYKAWQVRLKRFVTLKMLRAGDFAEPEQVSRFSVEAETIARLRHPHIVQIYEVAEYHGRPYLALEFVDGGSLADRVCATPQQMRPAAQLVETVARAVHYAHEHGVIHRDLKPANILLQEDLSPRRQGAKENRQEAALPASLAPLRLCENSSFLPKIADFGLAKQLDADSGQTRSGAILGTPSYMAPEQAGGKNEEVGPAADIYALGAILYELLTGRPPFKGATVVETVEQVRFTEPVPPSRLQPKVPRDLQTICLKCLQKEPKKRYASAQELGDDLRRWLDGEPIRARPAGRAERLWRWCRRNPVVASLTAAVAMLLLAVAAASLVAAYRFNALANRERAALAEAEDRAEQIRQGIEQQNRSYRLLESGQLCTTRGQWSRALADYTEAIALRPDNPLVWLARGNLYAILCLWDLAAEDYAQAFERPRSNEASIWFTHAALRCYAGDTDGYRQVCAGMADHFGPAVDAHTGCYVAQACTLAPNDVDPARLVRLAEGAVASDPQRPSYLITLGAAHYRGGQFEQAIQRLQEALRSDNGWINSEAWPLLAMAHHRLGQHPEALQWLDKTRQGLDHLLGCLNYDQFDAWLSFPPNKYDWLSVFLLYREAQALVDVPSRTDHPLRWLVHCRGHAVLGQLELAAATFARAIESQPAEGQLWLARGRYFGRLGQWDRAASDFAQLFVLQPPDAHYDWCFHAALRLKVGDREGYRRVCAQMLERFGQTTDPHVAHQIALACSLAPTAVPDLGCPTRLAELALSSDPNSPWHLFIRGAVAYRMGQFGQAADYCRQALKERWPDPVWNESGIALARLFLSLACYRLHHKAEAHQELDQAVQGLNQAALQTRVGDFGRAYPYWAICQILRQEVEALAAGNETAAPKVRGE